ncbi:MAG: hypothetical protein QGF29_08210 [Verrucomicrobiota bacterium]|nr:hypothetical protein [Verrucomicrobiota bacterium]
MPTRLSILSALLLGLQLCALGQTTQSSSSGWFAIRVVDAETGRGVPLVELETVNHLRFYTDSNGTVAFREPGLMGRQIFFHVRSHGYEYPKDSFGYRGVRLKTTPGTEAVLKLNRLNIAERLYRVTGAGIYRDSRLLGRSAPIEQPLLNGMVFGSDSVVTAVYRGKLHWFWGDTNRPSYPLGNFHVPFATSLLPGQGGLDPGLGVNLTYAVGKNGFAKEAAKMPGKGPTWIDGLVVLPDKNQRPRLLAQYVKIKSPLTVYERGLVQFDDERQQFGHRSTFPKAVPLYPHGHPFLHRAADGREYVYFAGGMPLVRVRASLASYLDPSQYETYTFLPADSGSDVQRNPDGSLKFEWCGGQPKLDLKRVNKLIAEKRIKAGESPVHLIDIETGKPVLTQHGSVYWNEHRQRWVMIISQSFGSSMLGEIWFAEASRPEGPWFYARKIVTHDDYSFYNPKQHPYFAKDGGRTLFFEATYTSTFSGNKHPTPLYDYNQVMYRLELDDPRLNLPVPVYERPGDGGSTWSTVGHGNAAPRFFALPKPAEGTIPIGWDEKTGRLVGMVKAADTLFHAAADPAALGMDYLLPLHEWTRANEAQTIYSHDDNPPSNGKWKRSVEPLCHVWPLPRLISP